MLLCCIDKRTNHYSKEAYGVRGFSSAFTTTTTTTAKRVETETSSVIPLFHHAETTPFDFRPHNLKNIKCFFDGQTWNNDNMVKSLLTFLNERLTRFTFRPFLRHLFVCDRRSMLLKVWGARERLAVTG